MTTATLEMLGNELPAVLVDASPVNLGNERYQEIEPKQYLDAALGGFVESCSDYTGKLMSLQPGINSFVAAANVAYDRHYPMYLSPDIIWLVLTQGLARHINENAEALRSHFVKHSGKALIHVQRDDFIRLSPENPWEQVFPEFSMKIKDHIGAETHKLIVADFSTTDSKAKAASELTLMDAMQSYFEYGMTTCCGIPHFEISGTVEDWERMYDRVGEWAKWDLDWWVPHIQHVIANFVLAAKGEADQQWWSFFFKEEGGSGGPFINGWINWLFPYLQNYQKKLVKNKYIGDLSTRVFCGTKTNQFPASTAKAPFWWNYYGNRYDYQFVGGLMGAEQREDLTVKPRVGWAVMEDPTVDKEQQGRPFDPDEVAPVVEPPNGVLS